MHSTSTLPAAAPAHGLAIDSGVGLNVEVSAERYGELALRTGETAYAAPRKVRTFTPNYVI